MRDNQSPETRYDAFISYRRSDGRAVARWLRRELENFRAPKALRDRFGTSLKIYLDTAYERGTSDFYAHSIRPALLASTYLLVVATPDALRRPGGGEDWIDREITDFTNGPNGGNVIVVRGAGQFDGPLPGELKQRFPNIEIVDLRGAGRFAFLNPIRASRLASEKLKLIAPLLALPADAMPQLRQEAEMQQQTRLGATIGATLGVIVAVTGLSIFALQSRNSALRALDDSMYAAGGMALSAAELNAKDALTQRTRRLIINRGCDLVDKFRLGAGSEPPVAEVVMCRIERAGEHAQLQEHDKARARYIEAADYAAQRHRLQGRPDAGLGLIRAREAHAAYLIGLKATAEAEAELVRLLADSQGLAQVHSDQPAFLRAQGEALGQLGDIYASREDKPRAVEAYDAAAAVLEQAISLKSGSAVGPKKSPDQPSLAWLARLHQLAGGQIDDTDEAMIRFSRSVAVAGLAGSATLSPDLEQTLAVTQAMIFDRETKRGDTVAAGVAKVAALAGLGRIAGGTGASKELKAKAARLRQWLEARGGR